ncbi:MAG: amino acid racemase [Verrucomicrobia bacterium]|nr:amino acid racemase [Verrucomicrobiota bacterium]
MKTIGLLGGTGWSSTIGYYTLLNKLMNARLGGRHSAKVLLKSIDYHDLWSSYGNDQKAAQLLQQELTGLIALKPDCIIICCNTLHKYYDMIKNNLNSPIPVMHAVDLVAQHAKNCGYKKVLLLATKFTMEDGFFAKKLENAGIDVVIPVQQERQILQDIHAQLMVNNVTTEAREYFRRLILQHNDLDAVILGCTEYPLVVDEANSALPIIDPVSLQTASAVNFALAENYSYKDLSD